MFIKILVKILEHFPIKVKKAIADFVIDKILNKYATINVEGYENLKGVNKPIIFICNHLSNADGLVLNRVLENEQVTFVSGVKLSNNSFTKIGVFGVKTTPIKPNSTDKEGLKKIIKILRSKNNLVIFPEGSRSRTGSMIEGKKGVVLMKQLSNASMIPIGLTGTEKLLPINDEDMGKERFQHAVVNIKIGKPIQVQDKDTSETKKEYEERALNALMCGIAELLPKEYQGIYANSLE